EVIVRWRRRAIVAAAPATAAVAAAAEELDVVRDDLSNVALVAVLIVVGAGLDAALDEDLAPLRQVLRADLGALAPHHDPVPLGALLPLPVLVVPALAGREAQLAHALPARRVPHVGIGAQVPHEDDFVDSAGHELFFFRSGTTPSRCVG